ncbi:NAD(P)/FAD-dependent oxidoreductase [Vibrio methylphosphonaticus]|uniref:NAD(P)/FAD-dependent oxidoreductase n=1 Tax=Vibrio methylphosphonaticus TaxID=2946866 RepID=UPI00202A05E5|nr:FAD-dependent oxidoreductase [Vibrio methylphosphonaticus]MCL9774357.1 FAD-dependent oxidoreductase [Vibrio methylphosphonaticus]
MKIAIIGTGISGLTCGYHLHNEHDVTLFEANNYIGGHTATVDVDVDGEQHAVDTGFIVFNDRTYPHFIKMMDEIGVTSTPTQMSFSVKNQANGLEYNGHTVSTLFAQRKNWLSPTFYRFVFEILRFNQLAKEFAHNDIASVKTLGSFLNEHEFSDYFCTNYILPMGAAIWSSTLADMRAFPLGFFLRFFLNHGLLDVVNRPQWYVIDGGSRAYIEPLTRGFADKIHLNAPVTSVKRYNQAVEVMVNGESHWFDQVIFACHSDQALKMLEAPTDNELSILSDMEYQSNEVVLHTDVSLLPKEQRAWASWNYALSEGCEQQMPTLTYNMNILQHIESSSTLCVSLNSANLVDSDKILRTFHYSHPVFTSQSIQAQNRREELFGDNETWFCGAYWYNGFHEDGVRSALDVVKGIQALNREQSDPIKGVA